MENRGKIGPRQSKNCEVIRYYSQISADSLVLDFGLTNIYSTKSWNDFSLFMLRSQEIQNSEGDHKHIA